MKTGNYVRTKNGISKIREIHHIVDGGECIMTLISHDNGTCGIENVIKSSQNIIDLIEKNDIVVDNYGNIYVVDYVFDNYIYTTTKQGNITKTLCDYQIKSIVTKEQFSSVEYRIGE